MKIRAEFVSKLGEIQVLIQPDESIVLMQTGAAQESHCIVLIHAQQVEISKTLRLMRKKPKDLEQDIASAVNASILLQTTRSGFVSLTSVSDTGANEIVGRIDHVLDCVSLNIEDIENVD